MNRNLPTFQQAEEEVKIKHFTRQGYDIEGVVHVGANNGYEIHRYLNMGIDRVIGIDPLPVVHDVGRFYHIPTFKCALGDRTGFATLYQAPGDGGGSSLLCPLASPGAGYTWRDTLEITWCDLVELANINVAHYDCLVVDTQGYELRVLRGMGPLLQHFKYLNIECSRDANYGYTGVPAASDVIGYLKSQGFKQETPIEEHNDIMFIRELL